METFWRTALPIAEAHDAAQDTSWSVLYDRLNGTFPGAKFINVVRQRDAWINSVLADFGKHHNEIHRLIYGSDCPVGHEEEWLDRYDRHNREVADYFRDRPDDFLLLDISDGDRAWEQMCRFLGHAVPECPWPHLNKRHVKRRKMFWRQQRDRVQKWLRV